MKNKKDKRFMKMAIQEARKNIASMDGGPFGACIVKGERMLAVARNTVLISDASAHAEINAIRLASKKINNYDLSGCVIYSTTEPCPMCFAAIHWANIEKIIFGTDIKDAAKIGFNELRISAGKMRQQGRSKVKIESGFLRDDCLALMNDWGALGNKVVY